MVPGPPTGEFVRGLLDHPCPECREKVKRLRSRAVLYHGVIDLYRVEGWGEKTRMLEWSIPVELIWHKDDWTLHVLVVDRLAWEDSGFRFHVGPLCQRARAVRTVLLQPDLFQTVLARWEERAVEYPEPARRLALARIQAWRRRLAVAKLETGG